MRACNFFLFFFFEHTRSIENVAPSVPLHIPGAHFSVQDAALFPGGTSVSLMDSTGAFFGSSGDASERSGTLLFR